ncbi:hypothetical protein [Mycolicibacterium boenickei]|nr:hypothetical protein [Mycolicibacterium boenickei]
MTVSALALAAALVLWPATPRRTAALRRVDSPVRRMRAAPVVVPAGVLLAWVMPLPVALAAAVVAGTVAIRRR